jgi:hypothetical protein
VKVFNFDPADHLAQWNSHGWVHVRNGVDPEFFAYLRDFVTSSFSQSHVEGKAIGGQKDQALFEFPSEVDFQAEVFDVIASLCGLDREGMTLSERHIKLYNADADPEPVAHKDRYSSQVSVGISIDIPAESRLVLYPKDQRAENPFNVSPALLASLDPDEHPAVALQDAEELVIDDEPGDVMLFPGRSMWHLRRNPARATNLYLKFNDFGSDPLGEDPATGRLREGTLAVLNGKNDFGRLVPVPARRLDTLTRHYTREGGEVLQANVWEQKPLTLGTAEFKLLQLADGRRDLAAVAQEISELSLNNGLESSVRRLAENGALDLVAR